MRGSSKTCAFLGLQGRSVGTRVRATLHVAMDTAADATCRGGRDPARTRSFLSSKWPQPPPQAHFSLQMLSGSALSPPKETKRGDDVGSSAEEAFAGRAGYGWPHRRRRRGVAPVVDAGLALCCRCGLPIEPGQAWDLDHRDDRRGYLGPSHTGLRRIVRRVGIGRPRSLVGGRGCGEDEFGRETAVSGRTKSSVLLFGPRTA